MSKNTNKDYYEDEIHETELILQSAIEMQELIEQKLENEPAKGKLHVIWKRETNNLIDSYNNNYGHVYNHVK